VTCDETAIDHAYPVRGAGKRIENEYGKEGESAPRRVTHVTD